MFDFNKPKIEIAEISEDKKYGRFVCEPLERAMALLLEILLGESCSPHCPAPQSAR